ncbi:unnamed protein product [Lymnaea stagnalis]|uniref:Immunoglobulin domain-containing protein n=1 Tax=Lymnaea stagnalis TaxID=6523 RepID=A0AAV2I073_LYMST
MFSYVAYIIIIVLRRTAAQHDVKDPIKIESFTINGVELITDDVPRSTFSVAINSTVTFVCTATGFTQDATVGISKWGGKKLNQTLGDRVLSYTIDQLQCYHMDIYSCHVRSYGVVHSSLDLNVKNCGPRLCRQRAGQVTQVVQLGQSAVFSLCVISHANRSPTLVVNGSKVNKGIHKDNIKFNLYPIANSSLFHDLTFEVKVLNKTHYGVYHLSLGHGSEERLNIQLKIQAEVNSTSVKFKSNITGNGDALITCVAENRPKYVAIWKGNQETVKKYGDGNTTVLSTSHLVQSSKCGNMGNYRCVVTDYSGEEIQSVLNVQVEKCKFSLCQGESYRKAIYTKLGDDVWTSMCLRRTDGFQKVTKINGASYLVNDASESKKYGVWIFPITEISKNSYEQFNLMIYIRNITETDCRNHTITLNSLTYQELAINLEIIEYKPILKDTLVNFKSRLTLAVTLPIVITVLVALILGSVYGARQLLKGRRICAQVRSSKLLTRTFKRKDTTDSVLNWDRVKRNTTSNGGNLIENVTYQPESILSVLSGQEMYEMARSQFRNTSMDMDDETMPLVDTGDLQHGTGRLDYISSPEDTDGAYTALNDSGEITHPTVEVDHFDGHCYVNDSGVCGRDVEFREKRERLDSDDSMVSLRHKSMFVPETEALLNPQRKSMSVLERRKFRF